MIFKWFTSKDKLDTKLCIVDERLNHMSNTLVYSGLGTIIDKLIERNNVSVEPHEIDLEFKSKCEFKYGSYSYKNGLWQKYTDPIRHEVVPDHYIFIAHEKLNKEGSISYFPGTTIKWTMLEDGICEIKILSNNSILNKYIEGLL